MHQIGDVCGDVGDSGVHYLVNLTNGSILARASNRDD
jgi:hypothetical protein